MTNEYVNVSDRYTDESIMSTNSKRSIDDNFLDEGQIQNFNIYVAKVF